MIIPQIAQNLTRSGLVDIPEVCPACGGRTNIKNNDGVETLYCSNPECPAKAMKSYTLFVSRDALNMDGLSEATLEKFMAHGMIRSYADLFRLEEHKETIVSMEGFGLKSYENLIAGIKKASTTTLSRLLYAIGIPNIGIATAKLISKAFDEDIERIRHASVSELSEIEGIGEITASLFVNWWHEEKNIENFEAILPYLTIEKEYHETGEEKLKGKIFVVTGSLTHFTNRNALKALIEQQGGKVTGSVSKKTDYLINTDVTSGSSKNKAARELGIPILSEEDFVRMLEET